MTTLLIATRNRHKVQEIQAILGEGFRCLTLNDFPGAPAIREDADTFAGNATLKAVGLAKWLAGLSLDAARRPDWVLADDSGLEVDALNGAPGVYSARYAGLLTGHDGNTPDADNNARLLRELAHVPREKRTGRFRCVIALTPVTVDNVTSSSPVCLVEEVELRTEVFSGACEGWLDFAPRGQGGFGYDPLFIPNGYDRSFAELGEAVKNSISHRSKAMASVRLRLAK